MDGQAADKIISATERVRKFAAVALIALSVFLFVEALAALKGYRYIGSGVTATNSITVSGEGEVFAVPDTATFSVTVQEEAKQVADAQDVATKKSNDIVAYLKKEGIEEKDIKTTDYSVYPQYDYIQVACSGGYCPGGRQELRGFQVSQTLTVKVRDTKKAGDLLSGVGGLGASSVSGLSFTIDDEDALKAEARDKAIAQAKEKAEALADSLGVEVVRVVGFYENEGGYPAPYAYGMGGAERMDASATKASPELPAGENKITSNVNITYEIR